MFTTLPEKRQKLLPDQRILWLDLLRIFCAIEIVGFHWLRAGTKTGAFAKDISQSLIIQYRQLNIGLLETLQRLHIDSSPSLVHRWLTDSLGVAFGFGWEAVFVFVLLSGTALSLALGGRRRPASWPAWIGKRFKRILLPYYLIAGIVTSLMFAALFLSASRKGPVFQQIHRKLAENIGPDFSGIAWSQLLLFDPHKRLWSAMFLAPAWWFVPAILLAYALFPFYMWLLERTGKSVFLGIGACISIFSYAILFREHVQEFSWFFVILNECFNFFLGIVLGCYLATAEGRIRVERALQSPGLISAATILFLVGNLCNLYHVTYAISSLFFTASLAFCGAAFAQWFCKWRVSRSLLWGDPYHLYLVHQPIAFPMIVLSELFFGRNAVLIGFPFYLVTTFLVSAQFSKLFKRLMSTKVRPT